MPPNSTNKRTPHPLAAAQPSRNFFDPWNSSSTGHQRAENRLSSTIEWRDLRTLKLQEQLHDGGRRRRQILDKAESEKRLRGTNPSRTGMNERMDKIWTLDKVNAATGKGKAVVMDNSGRHEQMAEDADPTKETCDETQKSTEQRPEKQIFRGLKIYINGSTYPLISDHKLKRELLSHGAKLSIVLGRRSVTHVILGSPVGASGAGGGLAGGKIQKEISLVRGKSVRFVTAEWAIESLKAGKRLPESRFVPLKLATKRQLSVRGMLECKSKEGSNAVGKDCDAKSEA